LQPPSGPAEAYQLQRTSYTGSSSNGNAFFAATNAAFGLSIESINVSNYNNLTLQFGYRKESGTSHASLSVDYWNGTSWITIANTSSALFNESASAATGWYLSKTLSLPTGAQTSGLKIRFVKTGSLSIRIDDVVLKGVLSYDPSLVVSSASTFVSPAINSASSEQSLTVSGNYLVDNIFRLIRALKLLLANFYFIIQKLLRNILASNK
jgi:hypothetical protein